MNRFRFLELACAALLLPAVARADQPPVVTTGNAVDKGATLATLTATVNPNGSATTAKFQVGLTTAYDTEVPVTLSPGDGVVGQAVSAQLNDLTPLTTYHYRIVATNGAGTTEGADATFTTIQPLLPLLIPGAVEIGATSVTLNGLVDSRGSPYTAVYQWGETTAYGTDTPGRKLSDSVLGAVEVSATLTGLTPGKLYHYRLSATNLAGTATSADMTFITVQPPVATTGTASNILATSAVLAATVNPNGNATTVKFQSGLTPAYGTDTAVTFSPADGTLAKTLTAKITGLNPNTTYHYRISATNSGGTTNGNDMTFTTLVAQQPDVTITFAAPLASVSATINYTINPHGLATTAVLQSGLTNAYGTDTAVTPNPGSGDAPIHGSVTLTGLAPGKTYHCRLSATNVAGTATTPDFVVQTLPPTLPIAQTYLATTIGATSATLNAIVASYVDQPATAKFQYGLTADYGFEAAALGSANAGVSAAITGLAPGTTYHYSITATNIAGTKNGDDMTFTTFTVDMPQPPYAGTAGAGLISYSTTHVSATLYALVCPNGLSATAKFQVGTTTSYGDDFPVPLSPGDGTALQQVKANVPLQPSTTYHCRLVATNAAGTTNGVDTTFTTNPLLTAPVIGDIVPSSLTSTSEMLSSTINPGGDNTTASFQYGLTTNYGSSRPIGISLIDSTTHPVTTTLGGLTPNTTYHCRITATNQIGTTNSPDVTFTTPGGAPGPWLTYEMRIDPTTSSPGVTVTDAHHAAAGAAGDVVGVQIYAVVNSANGSHADDGFLSGEGSFVSTGALLGDLRGDVPGHPATQVNNVAPFNLGAGAPVPLAQSGFQADLDGDGDLDVGSNLTTANALPVLPWFIAFSNVPGTPIFGSGAGTGPTEFLIGRTTFTVGAGAQAGQGTTVHFAPTIRTDGALAGKTMHHLTLDGVALALQGSDPNIATVDSFIVLSPPVPQPPVAITGAATGIGAGSVTLNATVNPNGTATTAKFQSGLTDAYGTDTAVTLTPIDGTSAQSVSTTLTGLAPNTTYHFRIEAANGAGTTDGADVSFTTAADAIPPTIVAPDGGFLPLTLTTGANGTAALPDYTGQAVTGDNIGVTAVTQVPAPGAVNAGPVHVVLTAHDAAENTADAAFDVTVLDGTAPVITHVPDAISAIADATVPDVTGSVTATDNVGVASITQAPLAGTSVGIGQTNIVVTVADAAGNTATAGVVFTVVAAVVPPPDQGRGYYSGLLDDGVGSANGLVVLFVNGGGAFSGKASLQGVIRGFQGVFHGSIALVNIPGSGVLTLERNASGGIDLTLGAFSGHADNSPYTASAPAPMRGSYTVLLPPDPAHAGDATVPQGTGFATLKINPLGIARCAGRVGDGAPFAFDSSVHGDGTLPCYDGLYSAPYGSIGGTLTFRDLTGSDLDGTLAWSRPGQTKLPGVFHIALASVFADLSVPAIGSFYQPAATPLQMLAYADNHRATVTFHDGGLSAPMSGTATVSAALSAFVTPPMRTLYFSPSDGTFLGTLRPASVSAAPKPFFGIVFQKQNRGAGLFLGNGAVGGLDYTPQPGSTARR